jgi:hypothetical protein
MTEGLCNTYISPKTKAVECLWLVPIILAILEAEMRRIEVQSQSRQIVIKTLSRKNPSQKKRVGGVAQTQYHKKTKQNKTKKQYLPPREYEAPSSFPSATPSPPQKTHRQVSRQMGKRHSLVQLKRKYSNQQ